MIHNPVVMQQGGGDSPLFGMVNLVGDATSVTIPVSKKGKYCVLFPMNITVKSLTDLATYEENLECRQIVASNLPIVFALGAYFDSCRIRYNESTAQISLPAMYGANTVGANYFTFNEDSIVITPNDGSQEVTNFSKGRYGYVAW